ncbi:MAG: arylsulfotransferase family protein [Candidatus Eisenbacteria bacterium]
MKMSSIPRSARLFLTLSSALAVAGVLFLFAVSSAQSTSADRGAPPGAWRSKIREPETPTGGWRTARGSHLTEEQQIELNRLESLGYLAGGASAPSQSGITVCDESRSWSGLNLYVSGDSPGARLMDMDGNVLHEWIYSFSDAWPGRSLEFKYERGAEYWFHAHLFENGDIIGVFNGLGLVKLDKDSNLIWKYTSGSHHHIHVTDDGRIFTITREFRLDPRISTTNKMSGDAIAVLDANGRELSRVSVLEAFWNSDYASWLRTGVINAGRQKIDPFHTNRIVPLDGRLQGRIPAFKEGNVLLSMRNLNALAVLDMERGEIVWTMSGMWLQQHCPSVLDNGNILLFDNQGDYGSSRILEFDPVTQKIAWLYEGNGEDDFYSEKFGSVQRLPNGNSLIAESHFGRALEVTPWGDIVWEYYNPARAGDNNEFIANLFEIERLPQDFPTDWLN